MSNKCRCKAKFYTVTQVKDQLETLEWKRLQYPSEEWEPLANRGISRLRQCYFTESYDSHRIFIGFDSKDVVNYYDYSLETDEVARVWATCVTADLYHEVSKLMGGNQC